MPRNRLLFILDSAGVPRYILAIAFIALGILKFAMRTHAPESGAVLGPSAILAVGVFECVLGLSVLVSRLRAVRSVAVGFTAILVCASVTLWVVGVAPHTCGCFGNVKSSSTQHVAVSLALFAFALRLDSIPAVPNTSRR